MAKMVTVMIENVNTVGQSADAIQEHVFACHDEIRRLKLRLAEEIKWGHKKCTRDNCDNCVSSGTDCPANKDIEILD